MLCLLSCSEELELYAPEEEIYAVYGVLDPDADAQYIRVSRVFQIEADAVPFARSHDPSVPGLSVQLEGGTQTYTATWVREIAKDTSRGDFGPTTSAYRFETEGAARLQPGRRYTLHIRSDVDSSLYLTATTQIPPRPALLSPGYVREGSQRCLRRVPFEDSVQVRFRTNPESQPGRAFRYELRVLFRFWANGRQQTHHYGPTRLFDRSTGCSGLDNSTLCYLLPPRQVLFALRTDLQEPGVLYTYDAEPRCGGVTGDLSRAVELQVTAVDTFLGRYILANSPYYQSLNAIRTEYTNVTGTIRAVGVLGSIAYDNRPIALTACGEYVMGLRDLPPFGCE